FDSPKKAGMKVHFNESGVTSWDTTTFGMLNFNDMKADGSGNFDFTVGGRTLFSGDESAVQRINGTAPDGLYFGNYPIWNPSNTTHETHYQQNWTRTIHGPTIMGQQYNYTWGGTTEN
ncbi:hypothetical protein K8T06_15455, partial [bacterium]|nr:hypothetical protein [bacterium]